MPEQFATPRILDLSHPADRKILLQSAIDSSITLSLLDRFLDDYLSFFPESHWRKVYSGPSISVPLGNDKSLGFDLVSLLEITEILLKLKEHRGFEKLLTGFRSPGDVRGTLFEVRAAHWCSERAVSLSLESSPTIHVKDGIKHPDFLWHTTLGNLYCECKNGATFETNFAKRFQYLNELVRTNYKKYDIWHPMYRFDIRMASSTKNGIENRIRNCLTKAEVAIRIARREDPPSKEKEVIRTAQTQVTTEPTQIAGDEAYKNWQYSLTMSLQKERQRVTAKLLKDARTQLPLSGSSCVFIELGGGEAAKQGLETRLVKLVYSNTPWVSIWVGGDFYAAVWRQNQESDYRLTEEKRM